MELDPRLQNISAADLQDFAVPHYPNFDQGYESALFDNGLSGDHGTQVHPHTHPHAQAYAQFVNASNEPTQFDGPGTSPVQQRTNHNAVSRGRNVNGHSLNGSPVNTRQGRQRVPPHQAQPPQFENHSFTAPTVQANNQLQHTPITSASSSPLTQRTPIRPQPAAQPSSQKQLQPQVQVQSQPRAQPQSRPRQRQQTQQQAHAQPPPNRNQQHQQQHHQHQAHPPPQTVQPPAYPQSQPQPQPQSQSQQSTATPSATTTPTTNPSTFTHPSTFPLIPSPPNLSHWRSKFFNITAPLLLTSEQYHTYFPHVDNIYSHRSTQKYKKKPFVSHYWDCRLKGRPTGTPLSKLRARKEGREEEEPAQDQAQLRGGQDANPEGDGDGDGDKEVKKRKRKTRERDLCDVKIKVTEFFGRDELEAMGKGSEALDMGEEGGGVGLGGISGSQLTFVLEDGTSSNVLAGSGGGGGGHHPSIGRQGDDTMSFGVLEPLKKLPEGHPGADGKRWYMVQRVNGSGKDDGDASLDHKHTMEESDRIKKNSVQRWLLAREKERKKQTRTKPSTDTDGNSHSRNPSVSSAPSFHASGKAQQTAKLRAAPASSQLTFFANSFCPFAQRIWIALELKGIPYQYIEITPSQVKDGKCTIPSLLEVRPEGNYPLLRHGNWAVWESDIVLEYLEDLSIGHSLLPLGEPQLRAHSRLWKDHINRKVLPYFYTLLLLPSSDIVPADGPTSKLTPAERQSLLITTLQNSIIELVNASHATGPFFLGPEMSFVDVAFAPWIIRLSRVLEYYREFPKPEVGTRWKAWVDAIEDNDAVRRTVSDDKSYHAVYGGVGKDAYTTGGSSSSVKMIAEMRSAKRLMGQEGFGLGGDVWGTLLASEGPGGSHK